MLNRLECQRSAHTWQLYCFYTTLPQTLLWPSWQSLKRDELFVYLTIYLTPCGPGAGDDYRLRLYFVSFWVHVGELDRLKLRRVQLYCSQCHAVAAIHAYLPPDTHVNTSELSNSVSHSGPCFINYLGPCWVSTQRQWDLVWMSD